MIAKNFLSGAGAGVEGSRSDAGDAIGVVMLVRLVHGKKAPSPMGVTDLPSMDAGMVNAPDAFLSQPVIVIASPLISYFKLVTGTSSPPHPPRSRGSDTMIRNKGTGFFNLNLAT